MAFPTSRWCSSNPAHQMRDIAKLWKILLFFSWAVYQLWALIPNIVSSMHGHLPTPFCLSLSFFSLSSYYSNNCHYSPSSLISLSLSRGFKMIHVLSVLLWLGWVIVHCMLCIGRLLFLSIQLFSKSGYSLWFTLAYQAIAIFSFAYGIWTAMTTAVVYKINIELCPQLLWLKHSDSLS